MFYCIVTYLSCSLYWLQAAVHIATRSSAKWEERKFPTELVSTTDHYISTISTIGSVRWQGYTCCSACWTLANHRLPNFCALGAKQYGLQPLLGMPYALLGRPRKLLQVPMPTMGRAWLVVVSVGLNHTGQCGAGKRLTCRPGCSKHSVASSTTVDVRLARAQLQPVAASCLGGSGPTE